jgi:sporulation protein YlmC with PRC-barrel domain
MIQKDRARSAESSAFRSYGENKKSLGGSVIAGGFSADQLIGAEVQNASGKEIGEIEDLIIDSDNKVNKAIVEVGGFLGLGSKHVAVNIDQLKHGGKKDGFVTTMTKEELKTLPEYKKESGSWIRSYQ